MVGLGHDGTLAGDLMALGMTLGMALLIVIGGRSPEFPPCPPASCRASSPRPSRPALRGRAATRRPTRSRWLAVFGLVNSAIGFSLFLIGSRHLPPVETAPLGALEAPVAPLWVWLAFNETPSVATLIGGAWSWRR